MLLARFRLVHHRFFQLGKTLRFLPVNACADTAFCLTLLWSACASSTKASSAVMPYFCRKNASTYEWRLSTTPLRKSTAIRRASASEPIVPGSTDSWNS